ncbi:MAG: NAD(P)-dependent oxidoreductase [Candidatus Micrarchaeia archaeon]
MKIAVTGGDGRLGRLLVSRLKKRHSVVSVGLNDPGITGVRFAKADLLKDGLAGVFRNIDAVAHLAGTVDYSLPEARVFELNAEMTERVVQACRKAGVKRLVLASSTSVYHGAYAGKISERSPVRPANAYGRSKLAAEAAVKRSGVPFVVLRLNTVYGPGFKEGFLKVARAIKSGKQKIIGSGENRVGLLYADDAVDALEKALEKKSALGKTIIISSGEQPTQRACLARLAEALGVPAPCESMPAWLAYALASAYECRARLFGGKPRLRREDVRTLAEDRVFDVRLAKRALGFKAAVRFEKGVKRTVKGWVA